MLLRLWSNITIVQSSDYIKGRNQTFVFNFVNQIDIYSTWKNLTDTAKLVFPKKIYYKDQNGNLKTWDGQSMAAGSDPLFLRGDSIKIELGYRYKDTEGDDQLTTNVAFEGFITKVNPKIPIEIECEDNMWLLKRISTPNKVYKNADVESMISSMIAGTNFTLKTGAKTRQSIKTKIGDFRTNNETIGEVLDRLRKDYMIYSYFRGKELRCSGIVYYPEDQVTHYFKFQNNIISDSLDYIRKDDVKIAIKATSIQEFANGTTPSGKASKKKKQISVIYPPENAKGDIRQLYFSPEGTTEQEVKDNLTALAKDRIGRIWYEGFRGAFASFGLPFSKHGHIANITDNVLPERDGNYLIKGVRISFGMQGYRQSIELDIRTDGLNLQDGL